ncbi:hypothetical protein [Chryseobacterium sp. MMS23-Vi53]|uniref:hypothetical protein n=1 Tax=Chryseobacterium sp. MMS23-Vi53 TaxID=3386644 RepID=UPI0039EAB46D
MKLKFVFILLSQTCILNAQLSNKVRTLAKPLDTISFAESSHIGIDGEESKIYNSFKKLSKTATNNELYYFAKNGSNALKLYSSKELLKRNDKRFIEIYKYYSDNLLQMKYREGCVGKREDIAYYLKSELYSAKEIISIRDSLLLKKNRSQSSNAQLKSIKEEGYSKIRQKDLEYFLKEIEK